MTIWIGSTIYIYFCLNEIKILRTYGASKYEKEKTIRLLSLVMQMNFGTRAKSLTISCITTVIYDPC